MEIVKINEMLEKLAELGYNQSSVCKNIDVKPALMSQIKKGVYKADATPHIEKLESFYNRIVNSAAAPKLLKHLPFTETNQSKIMTGILYKTACDGDFTIICGEPGYGKTTVIEQYCLEFPETILIEADDTYTKKVLMSVLSIKLGGTGKGTLHSITEDVISRLINTKRPIIIDEANELKWDPINLMPRVYDKCKAFDKNNSFGLVLVGHPELRYVVEGTHGSKKQTWSRIDTYLQLQPISKEDLATIILKVLPNASKSVINEFAKQSVMNTRVLEKLVKNTIEVAHNNEMEITPELIKQSIKRQLYKGIG